MLTAQDSGLSLTVIEITDILFITDRGKEKPNVTWS